MRITNVYRVWKILARVKLLRYPSESLCYPLRRREGCWCLCRLLRYVTSHWSDGRIRIVLSRHTDSREKRVKRPCQSIGLDWPLPWFTWLCNIYFHYCNYRCRCQRRCVVHYFVSWYSQSLPLKGLWMLRSRPGWETLGAICAYIQVGLLSHLNGSSKGWSCHSRFRSETSHYTMVKLLP